MIAAGAMALSSWSVVSNASRLRGFGARPPDRVVRPASEPRVGVGATEPEKKVDPVCGMKVDPASAAATVGVNGTTYYFCSTGCRDQFLAAEHQRGSA